MSDPAENQVETEENESGEDLAAEWEAMLDDEPEEESEETGSQPKRFGRILNQEEIDSLLGFDDDAERNNINGIEAIINSALVSYERLPMLEVVFDRLIRLMSTSLRNFTSDNVDVSIESMTAVRFGDYLESIPLPAMLCVFKAEEWGNYGLSVVDSALIYSVVDVLLGGRRGTSAMAVEGRPYTTIELSLIERMLKIILNDFSTAFDPLSKVEFNFERLETNPRFATIARPANAAILAKFRIDMEDRGGRFDFILPYATIEPVREQLLQMFLGEKFGRDSIWETHLATQLWTTNMPVKAILSEQTIPLDDVLNWKPGTQLMLDVEDNPEILVKSGDVDLFSGKMGNKKGNVAVKIEKSFIKKEFDKLNKENKK